MCDASEHSVGSMLLIEDYRETNDGPKKSYAPVAFGSQRFTEGQMSLTRHAKEFLAMLFAFDEIAHIFWGIRKPTIVMTDNKALTQFLQSKEINPHFGITVINRSNPTLCLPMYTEWRTPLLTTLRGLISTLGIHLKLNDKIPAHYIKNDLAAKTKTPEQDGDSEVYDPDQLPEVVTNPNYTTQMRALLHSVATKQCQHDDELARMIQISSTLLEPVLAGDALSIH